MKTGWLNAIVPALLAATAMATPASRLQFTAPPGWTTVEDPTSHVVTATLPGAKAAATFAASREFSGNPEQWHHQMWTEVLQTFRLAGPSQAGVLGPFLTRMGIIQSPDGSHPWICLYSLVNGGRGEAAIYVAADEKTFMAYLATVNQMLLRVTVGSSPALPATPAPPSSATTPAVPADAPGGAESKAGAATLPVLGYTEPPGFYRSAIYPPASYTSNETNAGYEVYDFRPVTGDIAAVFRRTLLGDWIDPQFRGQPLAGAPQFSDIRVAGATTAVAARFQENNVGQFGERLRVLVVVDNQAALVDLHASSTGGWQRVGPALGAMVNSLHVERKAPPPSLAGGPGPDAAKVVGLFMAFKSKYTAGIYGMAGSGGWKSAVHYYVFSPDGRVYCCYDFPPGGNEQSWRSFNFDAAQRADPDNTGRYRVDGNQLLMQMSARNSQLITARITDANHLEIETHTYERQQ